MLNSFEQETQTKFLFESTVFLTVSTFYIQNILRCVFLWGKTVT